MLRGVRGGYTARDLFNRESPVPRPTKKTAPKRKVAEKSPSKGAKKSTLARYPLRIPSDTLDNVKKHLGDGESLNEWIATALTEEIDRSKRGATKKAR